MPEQHKTWVKSKQWKQEEESAIEMGGIAVATCDSAALPFHLQTVDNNLFLSFPFAIIDTTVILCAINTTSQAPNCVACSTSCMSTHIGLECSKARSIARRFLQPRFRAITVYFCIDEGMENVSKQDT